jgi:hypothetical protein
LRSQRRRIVCSRRSAALAIATDLFMATRCARLRRACDRHVMILLGVPTAGWPNRKFADLLRGRLFFM